MSSKELSNIWLQEYKLIPGTADIVDRLKNSLYEIIFLSDNVQERIDYLENKYPFLHKFNSGVFSHIAKTRKPDPVIYELALAEAINTSHECVYIDDKEELLEPAKALGMSTIHFKYPEQLEEELKKLGLIF
ncbi:MAG: HAD-IA family hydrolase [candidate division SR1 bacterium]|nr:HAD-IA family hydrolase [candidate division SR1 bacterium]